MSLAFLSGILVGVIVGMGLMSALFISRERDHDDR